MFSALSGMTMGIVVFAVLAVVGTVVLSGLNSSMGCASGYTFNNSVGTCYETANTSHIVTANTQGVTGYYMMGQLGSTSGGLASYAPALIAVGVGAIFIGLLAGFMMQRRQA